MGQGSCRLAASGSGFGTFIDGTQLHWQGHRRSQSSTATRTKYLHLGNYGDGGELGRDVYECADGSSDLCVQGWFSSEVRAVISNQERETLTNFAREWWIRVGYDGVNRGCTDIQFANGGIVDAIEMLVDFAEQLPAQREIAMLPTPTLARLKELAQIMLSHDPYKRALEDHMQTCNRPIILPTQCPSCGHKTEIG